MKHHDHFSGLLQRAVNINPDRLQQLTNHEQALTAMLRNDAKFGPMVEGFSRQGSWAHRTIIRPLAGQEFDADLLVQMRQRREWSNSPRLYADALYDAVQRSRYHRDKAVLKTRCVRVSYANDCHVDLVPYVHLRILGLYNGHVIVNRQRNAFEEVNPDGFANWVRAKDRIANGHLRTTLRLLKYMRDYKGTFQVPSAVLTVIVGTQVDRVMSWWWDGYKDLPTAFATLVSSTDQWLQDRKSVPQIPDPTCPGASFGHRLTATSYLEFRGKFHVYADTVQTAYDTRDPEHSAELWRRLFGDAFAAKAANNDR
jgi:hypothetical protein